MVRVKLASLTSQFLGPYHHEHFGGSISKVLPIQACMLTPGRLDNLFLFVSPVLKRCKE